MYAARSSAGANEDDFAAQLTATERRDRCLQGCYTREEVDVKMSLPRIGGAARRIKAREGVQGAGIEDECIETAVGSFDAI